MQSKQALEEKVREVSVIILSLEKAIAEEETNDKNVDSIRNKIENLKRKLGLFREIMKAHSSSSPTFNSRHVC